MLNKILKGIEGYSGDIIHGLFIMEELLRNSNRLDKRLAILIKPKEKEMKDSRFDFYDEVKKEFIALMIRVNLDHMIQTRMIKLIDEAEINVLRRNMDEEKKKEVII